MTTTSPEAQTAGEALVSSVADALADVDCEERAVCFAQAAVAAVAETHWLVPKRPHDDTAPVGPHIRRSGWIHRAAGDSDPDHTRLYAAQLLAAADEAERLRAEVAR